LHLVPVASTFPVLSSEATLGAPEVFGKAPVLLHEAVLGL
jgi:hypothetical protein